MTLSDALKSECLTAQHTIVTVWDMYHRETRFGLWTGECVNRFAAVLSVCQIQIVAFTQAVFACLSLTSRYSDGMDWHNE